MRRTENLRRNEPSEAPGEREAANLDTADLLYGHGIAAVLVSALACSALAFICLGQVPEKELCGWWAAMIAVLCGRAADIWHFYATKSSAEKRNGSRDVKRYAIGVIATALVWAAFPLTLFGHLNETGRAYTAIILSAMVGGGATLLASSRALSFIYCALLCLPTSIVFLMLPGVENRFLGVLGIVFFLVMAASSRTINRAGTAALRLSRANEALAAGMTIERRRTDAINAELHTAQAELREANRGLEASIKARTAELENEMREKERYAKELSHLAATDSLTGLCNRATLASQLREILHLAAQEQGSVAVLFVDLDKFKEVNDFMGHFAGDIVLRTVADRLSQNVANRGELARWGGDEFVVTLNQGASVEAAINLANALRMCLWNPIEVDGGTVNIDATIGIALSPQHGKTGEDLIRAADVAMYAAKERKRAKVQVFERALAEQLAERHAMENAIHDAVHEGALSLMFQPIISSASGQCEAMEALARWNHPERGPIAPAEFIPLAERTGEIGAIGQWVLAEACREASTWPGRNAPAVSVNVSAAQIASGAFAADVFFALGASHLPPERLQLELTESVFAGDHLSVTPVLQQLRSIGVRISLDDFGTGFSCLAHLRKLPIDLIKIDKAFVEAINLDSAPIVKTIIITARTFGLKVIAEGVETEAQADRLAVLGADYMQGHLFSNALSASATREWLSLGSQHTGTENSATNLLATEVPGPY